MVRSYKDKELLDRVKSLVNFQYVPHDVWILGVRSNEDLTDKYDDKFYVFKGEQFLMVAAGTTNKGLKGTAVMMADMWHYDCYRYGLHKGKMPALRQVKGIPYTRDFNKDGKTDVVGEVYTNNIYMNFHGSTYNFGSANVSPRIGGWSEGCQVVQNNTHYERIIKLCKNQKSVTYCLINEF
jgi:hypothetical protein